MDTQINIWTVLIILSIHWFADFVLQSNEMATKKSKDFEQLIHHTIVYSLVWFLIIHVFIEVNYLYPVFYNFAIITFVFHTITDYFTSKLNTYLYEKRDIHNFFVSVGFDQLLHFIQLLLTYQYLAH